MMDNEIVRALTRESSGIQDWIGKEKFEEDDKNDNNDEHEEEYIAAKHRIAWEITLLIQNCSFLTSHPMHTSWNRFTHYFFFVTFNVLIIMSSVIVFSDRLLVMLRYHNNLHIYAWDTFSQIFIE